VLRALVHSIKNADLGRSAVPLLAKRIREHDRAAARERAVNARSFGELDRMLERRADPEGHIEFEAVVPSSGAARELRLQLLRRLGFLSGLGLAERIGKRTFQLSEDHRAALEQMQLARDLEQGMTRHGELLLDPDAPQLFTELVPGVEFQGRVVGGAEDEVGGRTFLILEGTDGAIHFVAQTPEIEEQRRTLSTNPV
jgi:hypothetical protein